MLDEGYLVELILFFYYFCYLNFFLEMLKCFICKIIIYVFCILWGILYVFFIIRIYMCKMIILVMILNKNKILINILINELMNFGVLIK